MAFIRLTRPARRLATAEDLARIRLALKEFPELGNATITVGASSSQEGTADVENMIVRFNYRRHHRRKRPLSLNTIGHELTHLLQHKRFGNAVPAGEEACDIWLLARSELFCDEAPAYLHGPWSEKTWPTVARQVHCLCREAIEHRKTNRRYIVWLRAMIEKCL